MILKLNFIGTGSSAINSSNWIAQWLTDMRQVVVVNEEV